VEVRSEPADGLYNGDEPVGVGNVVTILEHGIYK